MAEGKTIDPAVAAEAGSGMTREMRDRAVAVMDDVLAQLGASRLRPSSGSGYFSASRQAVVPPGELDGIDLRDVLDVVQPHCTVCMMGAALLSKARVYDGVPLGRVVNSIGPLVAYSANRETVADLLSDVFTPLQLDMIEAAFEETVGVAYPKDPFICGAAVFGGGYSADLDRAAAIAKNVIANDGVFVVEPVDPEDFHEESGDLDDDDDGSWDSDDDEDWDDDGDD